MICQYLFREVGFSMDAAIGAFAEARCVTMGESCLHMCVHVGAVVANVSVYLCVCVSAVNRTWGTA
jgi:hypothetical protein